MALLDWADRRVIEARHNWIMQQQLSNHFLLRRFITPQWKLLLDNFRFIPPVVELRNKDFVCFSTFRPDTNFGNRCHCKRFWGVPPKSNGCGHQTVWSLGGRSIRVKQPNDLLHAGRLHSLWKWRPNNNETTKFYRDHGGPYAPNRPNSHHLF